MRRSLLVGVMVAVGCSSEKSAEPPPPAGPLFADAFDDAAPLPRGWDLTKGSVTIADAPDARSGGRVLVAQSSVKRADTLLRKSLTAKVTAAASISCSFAVKLRKLGGNAPLTVARLDVAGGAALVDVKVDEWQLFGQFTAQQFAEGAKLPMLDTWHAVILTIEKSGRVVISLDGDLHVRIVDIAASPLDVTNATLDLGLSNPPPDFDAEAAYDDVVCTST